MVAIQRLMKDGLDKPAIARIAGNLQRAYPDFPQHAFMREANKGLGALELKARVQHVISILANHLPDDFVHTTQIFVKAAQDWDQGAPDDPLRSFAAWPMIDYVAVYGLEQPEASLAALRQLTGLFSAEFAIRPFITTHPTLTLGNLKQWTADPDEHVRRLVSEGTRPKLPWAARLPEFERNPKPVLRLLEKLKDDPSEYVRRSVANNLNDITKDHPEVVLETCRRWLRKPGKERERIVRHATRTLVKAGHPAVWELLGYTPTPQVHLADLQVNTLTIQIGEELTFSGTLESTAKQSHKAQRLVVDYAIHHVKANGAIKPKVFKLKTLTLSPGEASEITKRHAFRNITTRQYYSGTHVVEVLVNGQSLGQCDFQLKV
jgi:3-methyladenine DNA glycosylase AlkC